MDERSQVVIATLLGAVVGGLLGCLYLTDRGRRIRDQIDPALEGFVGELDRARGTVERARAAAREGRRAFDDVLAATAPEPPEPPENDEAVSSAESGAAWEPRDVRQASS